MGSQAVFRQINISSSNRKSIERTEDVMTLLRWTTSRRIVVDHPQTFSRELVHQSLLFFPSFLPCFSDSHSTTHFPRHILMILIVLIHISHNRKEAGQYIRMLVYDCFQDTLVLLVTHIYFIWLHFGNLVSSYRQLVTFLYICT